MISAEDSKGSKFDDINEIRMPVTYIIAILQNFPLNLLSDNFLSQRSRVIWKLSLETKGTRVVVKEINMKLTTSS